jgi:two-component system, chemotaxis family, sensor kinase CheA
MSDKTKDNNDSTENIIKELRATFREEAYELLAELESALLELEKNPEDKEQIGRAFRAMHTIKGSGGACEFHDIVSFTHDLETMFDKVRSGKVVATRKIIDIILLARDHIKAMLNSYYQGGSTDESKGKEIIAQLKELMSQTAMQEQAVIAPERRTSPRDAPPLAKTYRIRFRPSADVFDQGVNPVKLLDELRELGQCKIVAQTEAIPFLEGYDPRANYTYWDVILTTSHGMNAIQDVFIFVKDTAEVKIEVIDEEGSLDDETSYKYLGDILVERGDLTPEDMKKSLKAKKRIGEVLVETGVVPTAKVESALVEQQHVRDLRERRHGVDANLNIRVATSKLDILADLVGELVTVQARLTQTALDSGMSALISIAEEVERLTGAIRENTMNIRMLPIGTTFSKFKRHVRDLSSELGKEIELTTDGAETELDKTVIERLGDPLMHIIRNCIDHGIERPDERMKAGKPRKGEIHLSAVHSGAHVLISIRDDGAGLNTEAIRAKAIEKGILQPDTLVSEQSLREMIVAPGFSTAGKVTGLSGRGVGMDVVKKAIDALHGALEISSIKGAGTTITLKLPLTLAIIDGFLTRIGEEDFIFPLSLVDECVELTRENAFSKGGRHLIDVRGHIVPFIRLREQFAIKGDAPLIEQIVIARVENRRVGFVVDRVIGGHQTVIKNLGTFYKDVEGISGATILGDGTVALILDVPKLVHITEQEEVKLASASG